MLKKNAIVFRTSIERCEYIAPVVLQIESKASIKLDYIIYFDNEEKNKDKLEITYLKKFFKKIKRKLTIIFYSPPAYIRECFSQSNMSKNYPFIILAIYEIFNLLSKYKKVVILGSDTVVLNDISLLFNKVNKSTPVAYRIARKLDHVIKDIEFIKKIYGIEIKENDYTPNGDVIVISDYLDNYKKLTNQSYEILKNIYKLVLHVDEDVFGLLFLLNNIKINYLDYEWNGHSTYTDNLSICHTINHEKFWENYEDVGSLFPHFVVYYDLYCFLVQKDNKHIYKPSSIMLPYFYRKYWDYFYRDIFYDLSKTFSLIPNTITNDKKFFGFKFIKQKMDFHVAVELITFPKFIFTSRIKFNFNTLNKYNKLLKIRIAIFCKKSASITDYISNSLSSSKDVNNFQLVEKETYFSYNFLIDYPDLKTTLYNICYALNNEVNSYE